MFFLECGGNVTNSTIQVQTPGYPQLVKTNLKCVWVVSVPPKPKTDVVNIISFTYQLKNYVNSSK